MGRGVMIGRKMIGSVGQVAMSVVATLIATQIYTALQHEVRTVAPASPSLTSGGKFDARIAGAALPPLPGPARPALSIVDWSITPPHPGAPVTDVAWSAIDQELAPPAQPAPLAAPKPARRDLRRGGATAPLVASAASRPASIPQLDLHTAPAAPEAPAPAGLWSVATTTAHTLVSFGGSAVALGGSALGRLIP